MNTEKSREFFYMLGHAYKKAEEELAELEKKCEIEGYKSVVEHYFNEKQYEKLMLADKIASKKKDVCRGLYDHAKAMASA